MWSNAILQCRILTDDEVPCEFLGSLTCHIPSSLYVLGPLLDFTLRIPRSWLFCPLPAMNGADKYSPSKRGWHANAVSPDLGPGQGRVGLHSP